MKKTQIKINRITFLIAFSLFTLTTVFGQSVVPNQTIIAKVDEYMKSAVKFVGFSGSILVARDGSPIVSRGYGLANVERDIPNTPNTAFRIGAISRHFTAMAMMLLQERGKLKTNDLICKYLADCSVVWQTITIRQLLSHNSGIGGIHEANLTHASSEPKYPVARY